MRKILILNLLCLVLFSCSKQTTKIIEIKDVVLSAEAPYFEGPNSFQATLSETLKSNGIAPEQVDKVELTGATINMPDSIEAGLIQDFSLQLVSSSSKIKKVAFINPLVQGQKEVQLTVAQEQDDLADIFSKEEFIVLLDANLTKDVETPINFKTNLKFTITTH